MNRDILLADLLEPGWLEYEARGNPRVREVDRQWQGSEDEQQETADGGHFDTSGDVMADQGTQTEMTRMEAEKRWVTRDTFQDSSRASFCLSSNCPLGFLVHLLQIAGTSPRSILVTCEGECRTLHRSATCSRASIHT